MRLQNATKYHFWMFILPIMWVFHYVLFSFILKILTKLSGKIDSCIKLFDDDTTLFLIVENSIQAANLMDNDLDKVPNRANTWLVNFNPQKTEEMLFSRKSANIHNQKLSMDNTEIQRVQFHKHLGLTFNSDCSRYEHIIDITNKAWKRIHKLVLCTKISTGQALFTDHVFIFYSANSRIWGCYLGQLLQLWKIWNCKNPNWGR